MVKRLLFICILLIISIAVYLLFLRDKSDKEMIKESFNLLSACASKETNEGTSHLMLKSHRIASLFEEECSLEAKGSLLAGTYSPEAIASKLIASKQQFNSMGLHFYDLMITIDTNSPDLAQVLFTARLSGILKGGGRVSESREISALLRKSNDRWRFQAFKIVEVFIK